MEYIKKYKVLILIPFIILVFFMVFNKKEKLMIKVDLKGCVNKPGVYEIEDGSRVEDLIKKGGGVGSDADINNTNLSEILNDAMIVNIACIKKEPENTSDNTNTSNNANTSNNENTSNNTNASNNANTSKPPINTVSKISINSAPSSDLQTLPGIGPSKATAIIEYRKMNGPFKSLDDLKNVTGIGSSTYEKLKDKIIL